jgi:PPP family 3-phenylpropionic acid transporter
MPPRNVNTPVFASYFLLFASWAVLSPYLQLYLKARGLSASHIGLLLGTLDLAGIAGPLVLGRLADKTHAYRGLLAACFVIASAVFVPMEFTRSFPVYVACMLFMGLSYRAVIPLLDSLVSRILPDPARQYGRLRVAGSLGFVAISLLLQLSGWVSGESSRAILLAFVIAALCASAAVLFLPPAPPAPPVRAGHAHALGGKGFDLAFWAVIGIVFLGRFGIGAYYSFFSLYLKETFPTCGVSLLWAIGPLAEIATIWFSGPLIRRWGLRAMFIASLAAVSIRLLLFVFAPNLAIVALAQLLHAFTFGTLHTTAVAYVNAKIGPARRGMGMAVYNAVGIGLPTFLASVIGGFVIEAHGFVTLFASYAAVPVVGIVALLFMGSAFTFRDGQDKSETTK